MSEIESKLQTLSIMQEDLKEQKANEAKLRKEIAMEIGLENMKIGANKLTYGDLVVTATRKVTRSLDQERLETEWDWLSEEERAAISWKASLSMREYSKLPDTEQLDEFIEVKPAMPSITVKHFGE
jgi:hypothetical protein